MSLQFPKNSEIFFSRKYFQNTMFSQSKCFPNHNIWPFLGHFLPIFGIFTFDLMWYQYLYFYNSNGFSVLVILFFWFLYGNPARRYCLAGEQATRQLHVCACMRVVCECQCQCRFHHEVKIYEAKVGLIVLSICFLNVGKRGQLFGE